MIFLLAAFISGSKTRVLSSNFKVFINLLSIERSNHFRNLLFA